VLAELGASVVTAIPPSDECRLSATHFSAAMARSWPIAAVEFSDVANHVNCTTRQRSRSAAA